MPNSDNGRVEIAVAILPNESTLFLAQAADPSFDRANERINTTLRDLTADGINGPTMIGALLCNAAAMIHGNFLGKYECLANNEAMKTLQVLHESLCQNLAEVVPEGTRTH